MYYKSAEDIYNSMSTTITNVDKSENSLVYNTQVPCSMELSNALLCMDESLKKMFSASAYLNGYSYYLDLITSEQAVYRKQATFAVIKCKFEGKKNTTFKQGIVVSTKDNRLYSTIEDFTTDNNGIGYAMVCADNSGAKYNVGAGEICNFPINYSNLKSVTNEEEYTEAYDEETDESLYERYVDKIRKPISSGNKYQYEQWALEVNGVGYAKCIPAEVIGTGGVVKVVIASSNKRKASEELIKTTYDYIDSVRPVMAGTLEVLTVEEKMINITGNVEIDASTTLNDVQNKFKLELENYFNNIVYDTKKVTLAKVQSILININGVVDYSDVKINGGTSNITLTDEKIAVLDTVTLGVI